MLISLMVLITSKSGVILPFCFILCRRYLGPLHRESPDKAKQIGDKWVLGECAVTEKDCPSVLGITQVNVPSMIDACSLVSVFFYIPRNIIFHLRGQRAKHRLSSQITETPLGLNFMREFPESQNLILKLEIDVVLVSRYPSGFMSWPICAMNESLDHLPSSSSLNYSKQ